MAKYRRPSPDVAPGDAKVAGLYIICGIEKDRALKAGFDDALMLDWQGRPRRIDRRQHLPGDRRQAGHAQGREFPRRHHPPRRDGHGRQTRLVGRGARGACRRSSAEASEVFLCGTAAEIVPVGAIDGHRYQVGPDDARTLMADYQKLVRQPDSEGFGESAHLVRRLAQRALAA